MLLNRFEYVLMNNPLRPLVQKHFEAGRLLRMGGTIEGGKALELGCGRGVGVELIFNRFGARTVDAFDLDPRMVNLAIDRLTRRGLQANIWVGDAEAIAVPDASYDAVFDFGIIHHAPAWRRVLAEINRVLKPGGVFYGEEALAGLIDHPITRRLLEHPKHDRFNQTDFLSELAAVGFQLRASQELCHAFGWFVAEKHVAQ